MLPLIATGRRFSLFSSSVLSIALVSLFIPAGSDGARAAFDHEGLAQQMHDDHIRPGYDRFLQTAKALKTAVDGACQKRDAKDTDTVKSAFGDAVLAWSRLEHLRFGPVEENNRFARVMFWPDADKSGEAQVKQIVEKRDAAALNVAELQKKPAPLQGLTALEILLYANAEPIIADSAGGKFACGYAAAIAGNVAAIAQELAAAWAKDGSFAKLWLSAGEQNPLYKSAEGPSLDLLKSFRTGILNTRDLKLLGSLGMKRNTPDGPFLPRSNPPFSLSGLSIQAMIANLEGVLEQFDKGGFAVRLENEKPDRVDLVRKELQGAIKVLQDVAGAGPAAFTDKDKSGKLATLRDPLQQAFRLGGDTLEETVTDKVQGFTDGDGD